MATKTTFMTKLSSAITTIILVVGGLVVVGVIVFSLTFQEPKHIPVAPAAAEAKWPMYPHLYYDYPAEQILDIWGIPYKITNSKNGKIREICYSDGIRSIKFKFTCDDYPRLVYLYCQDIDVSGPGCSSFDPWQGTTAKKTIMNESSW